MTIAVRPYRPADAAIWDGLIPQSRTGSFLHLRNYMDYHADRFIDRSLILLKDDKPVALFPANQHDETIVSHGGLTYGGLISTAALRTEAVLRTLSAIAAHYRSLGGRSLLYKAVPHIFHRYPAEEDLYALFRMGAHLTRRDVSAVIALDQPPVYREGRKWSVAKAAKAGVLTGRGNDIAGFHELLLARAALLDRTVTHSLAELELLMQRFPQQIVLYEARDANAALLGGVLIYDFGAAVHTQYIGASEAGRAIGAVDLLLSHLIEHVYADRRYFSFGISTEQSGRVLNEGLASYKEGFGARGVVHDFYQLDLQ